MRSRCSHGGDSTCGFRATCRSPTPRAASGFQPGEMAFFVFAMQIGMWFGYVTFGFISDALGRKRTYVGYLPGCRAC